MGYSYSFFRPPADGPMSTWSATPPPPLGSEAEVKARLAEVFPGIDWRAPSFRVGVWNDGSEHAEFTVLPEEDGTVRFFGMTHCERADVERLARHLGPSVMLLDEQQMTAYSIADDAWKPTG